MIAHGFRLPSHRRIICETAASAKLCARRRVLDNRPKIRYNDACLKPAEEAAVYYAPRGTQDILPADRPYWRYVTEEMHAVAALFGLQQIDTPIFEEAQLFVRGVGEGTDIVDKEMYTFQDKGGAELTLRPEFTAGVMRAYIEHGMHVWPQPVKLYSIGQIFRYERPQAGRYRQHHQFNVEMLGELDPAVGVEVMSVAWTLLKRLGLRGLSFQIN
jgi:histidyl-tRNA synthetase